LRASNPDKIILFGSRARGDAGPDSDVDLLVIMNTESPDFVLRLKGESELNLVLETKGFDPLEEVNAQAARRWTDAVNADGQFGRWGFALVHKPEEIRTLLDRLRERRGGGPARAEKSEQHAGADGAVDLVQ
jgi:nucleotidyltransferase-like protein